MINVGGEKDWAPFDFVGENGNYTGLAKEYLDFIANTTGLKFKYEVKTWKELLDSLKNGSIDMLPAIYFNEERKKYINFAKHYLTISEYYFTRDDYKKIKNIKELYGKKIAVVKGYDIINWLKKNHPKIIIVEKASILDCLKSVESKESDCFIGDNPSTTYNIENNGISSIKINSVVNGREPIKLYMATKKDYVILCDIISKSLSSMTRKQKKDIAANWMSVTDSNKIVFSDNEQKWLDTKQVINYVYDPDWAPFEWSNELDKHTGIIADILDIVSERSGIKFKSIKTIKWNDSVKKMENHEADMYSAVVENEKRQKYTTFTSKNIYSSPAVIVSHKDDETIYLDIKTALSKKIVGVVKGNALFDYLQKAYPKLKFKSVDSTKDGFEGIENKSIDVFIVNAATAQYFIKYKGHDYARIVTKVDFNFDLKIALQKDMPKEIISILDKTIDTITDKELNEIYVKWTNITKKEKINWLLYGQIGGAIFLLLAFILFNNYKLKQKVNEKTKDLKIVLDEMEITIEHRTEELNEEKNFINTIMDSQENFVITTDGISLQTVNKSFLEFYNIENVAEFIKQYGNCICDTFYKKAPKEYVQKFMGEETWIKYVYDRPHEIHKVIIKKDNTEYIFSVTSEKLNIKDKNYMCAIFTDITNMEKIKKQIEATHKHTRESIEYAALIQSAVLPDNNEMKKYFKDQFVIWHPKDTVGGDIYFFNELRHDDECLLFFIDCTGHGVPGAFVTMLVKAVEQQVLSEIMNNRYDLDVSPAYIMSYFNKALKILLKQEDVTSISNAGWDGGIIYYNKKDQILKFAGAETALFYVDTKGEFHTVKGNRYSVGYKKCSMDYTYKETIIEVEEGMKFYCTTDGYLDQNGGTKDFPFGKKRFANIIKEYHQESMADQQEVFLYEMAEYEGMIEDNDRNDDMTVIGFEIGAKSISNEDKIIEIVKYEGIVTQNVIASAMDNIESKIENIGLMGTISTITIEYCQNMMNYSKNEDVGSRQIVPAGTIDVKYINDNYYEISATNVVSKDDKNKIEPKLIEIQGLDKKGIKTRYRELRKSGKNTHEKGGGIGMYEIAKVSDSIEYDFNLINEDKYYFTMKSIIKTK